MQEGPFLKIVFEPGSLGIDLRPASGLVTHVVDGGEAYRMGVCAGMRAMFVDGRPYTEDALDAAIASSIRYEVIFGRQEDKMDRHVLWSSSTKRAMETIRRHPNGCHVRWEAQSRSAGTSSSSQLSPACTEVSSRLSSKDSLRHVSKDSIVEGPQSGLEQAIPIERKHSAPVQHMWWYEDDDDQSSSLFSSNAGDGPRFSSLHECEEKRKVANKKKASEENTGAQTVAQGSDGAKADSRILENQLQSVVHLLGSESGSVCQQERAEKPRKPKKPELHQRPKQEYNVRECVVLDIVTAILTGPGPGKSDSDEEQVQLQRQQGKADADLSHFTTLSREELMSVVPLCGEGRPTSIGSIMHASGACKVCAFVTTSSMCKHGVYCLYCHLKHNFKSRNERRMRMRSRERLRNQMDRLCQQVESDLSLDLDTLEMPPSLFHFADLVKIKLRSYQQGLRTQQSQLSL